MTATTTTAPDQRRLLEAALHQLRDARARLSAAEDGRREPLAIVGAAVRAPGDVHDLDSFWRLLASGTDAVTPWLDDPQGRRAGGRATGRWAGLLSRIDGFDAEFFGIGPDEADHMDPQQRLVLEVAWEAIEDAGLPVERLRDRSTGVFLGLYGADYMTAQLAGEADITAYTGPGGARSIAANRLSYLLDLHGPSLTVDTACSSSLVALHLACRALRDGECDLALVGGVNVLLAESMMSATEKVLPMASGGRCRTFDAAADGIVRAEGCGVVLLERASDARARGGPVRALVRGSAVNHNGLVNGLTAPSPKAQADLLRRALRDAGVRPDDVQYVEAHGTGTRLGDPIEAEAICEVYGAGDQPCAIGSVKTNLGHQEAAAGIVGLLKTMLVLEHRQVPPSLHLEKLNPEIRLDGTRIVIPTAAAALPDGGRLLAAVSSFGFGGTNAHVVLEAAPSPPEPQPADEDRPPRRLLLPLSARSAAALGELAGAYADRLDELDARAAADLCAAAARGRSHHDFRLALGADDPASLARELRAVHPQFLRAQQPNRRVAFVFSGQGAQWIGMGQELLAAEPVARAEAEQCDAVIRELAGWSVLEELRRPEQSSRLHETEVAQACIAVLQLGLAALWRSWGVEPYAVVGHSMGEIVAARVAGELDREQALELLVTRARITEEGARGGAMAGIALPADEVGRIVAKVGGRIAVAAVNGPRSTVVSGERDLVAVAEQIAAAQGAKTRRLAVEYAFHSPLLDGRDELLAESLPRLRPRTGTLAHYSTVTGDRVRAADLGPEHWGRNLREPVLFSSAVRALARDGVTAFLEIGPHPVLLQDISAMLEHGDAPPVVAGSLRHGRPLRPALDDALGHLYRSGLDIRWDAVFAAPARHVPLPAYPWQRRRHWLKLRPVPTPAGTGTVAAPGPAAHEPAAPQLPAPAAQTPAQLEESLASYVRAWLAEALGLGDTEAVPPDGGLDALGLSSLMIVELRNRIERDFAVNVPLQTLLEGATPLALARAIARSAPAAQTTAANTAALNTTGFPRT
jgi:acyl transferase domain-containing protein